VLRPFTGFVSAGAPKGSQAFQTEVLMYIGGGAVVIILIIILLLLLL
jgi:hypothetical protein